MATASWAYHPAQHPWFKMASLKRIHPSEDDDSNRKRRRLSMLEHGFATLKLDSIPPSSITIEEIPPLATPRVQVYQPEPDSGFGTAPTPMDTDTPPLGMPQFATPGIQGTVEEPTSPDGASMLLPDVKMHNSSWYESEKDRIVITDLDASSDEEDSSRPHTPEPQMVISPAVMESLRRGAAQPMPVTTLRNIESKALVLYKPVGAPPPEGLPSPPSPPARKDESAQDRTLSLSSTPMDVDAMDVE